MFHKVFVVAYVLCFDSAPRVRNYRLVIDQVVSRVYRRLGYGIEDFSDCANECLRIHFWGDDDGVVNIELLVT